MRVRLRAERIAHGMTQETMARYMDMSLQRWHRKETGKVDFLLSECKKLSKLFNMPIETLFGEEETIKIDQE